MKKLLLVLAIVLLPIMASAQKILPDPPIPGPVPIIRPFAGSVAIYLVDSNGLPFGQIIRDKFGIHRVIYCSSVDQQGYFLSIDIATRGDTYERIYIPAEKVQFILTHGRYEQ